MGTFGLSMGPILWTPTAFQDTTEIGISTNGGVLGWAAVTDTWVATRTGQPMWLSVNASFRFSDDGPGAGEIAVTAPAVAGVVMDVGAGTYRPLAGGRIPFIVSVASAESFVFTECATGDVLGDNFTIVDGDTMRFCARYPLLEQSPA